MKSRSKYPKSEFSLQRVAFYFFNHGRENIKKCMKSRSKYPKSEFSLQRVAFISLIMVVKI